MSNIINEEDRNEKAANSLGDNSDQQYKKVLVVIPSLDPDEKLIEVVKGIKSVGFEDVLLVNDGSKQENLHYFDEAAAVMPGQVTVLHHPVNKGKGAAIKTALNWYLENRPDSLGVVTVDGDNQHHHDDTKACVLKMLETGHLILGVRDFSGKDVPTRSKLGNRSASMIFRLFCGMKISDTQTGLRVFPNSAIPTLAVAKGERFEYETNMLLILKPNGIKMSEQVIRTVYIEENKSSHYRTFKDTWRILKIVFGHFGIYIGSSLASFLVDNSLYSLFLFLIHKFMTIIPAEFVVGAAVLPARAISSMLNFYLNKRFAFENKETYSKTIWKYYAVCIPQMIITMVLLPLLSGLIGIPEGSQLNVLLKIVVETILFILSYQIQKNWVFKGQKKK